MIFCELEIHGVWLIQHSSYVDSRGCLNRVFDETDFRKNYIEFKIDHSLISKNPRTATLRGFHYQIEPFSESKTITCLSGAIYDVVIDLRKNSPTYKKWISTELHENDGQSLHIPSGCANAWLTLKPNTNLLYLMSHKYSPKHGRGLRFDDSVFKIKWPLEPVIISKKDLSWPPFEKVYDGI